MTKLDEKALEIATVALTNAYHGDETIEEVARAAIAAYLDALPPAPALPDRLVAFFEKHPLPWRIYINRPGVGVVRDARDHDMHEQGMPYEALERLVSALNAAAAPPPKFEPGLYWAKLRGLEAVYRLNSTEQAEQLRAQGWTIGPRAVPPEGF